MVLNLYLYIHSVYKIYIFDIAIYIKGCYNYIVEKPHSMHNCLFLSYNKKEICLIFVKCHLCPIVIIDLENNTVYQMKGVIFFSSLNSKRLQCKILKLTQ